MRARGQPLRPFSSGIACARLSRKQGGRAPPVGKLPAMSQPTGRTMNRGLIWTIVGILLVIALIIWIMRAL
jgi:hypothetical protein